MTARPPRIQVHELASMTLTVLTHGFATNHIAGTVHLTDLSCAWVGWGWGWRRWWNCNSQQVSAHTFKTTMKSCETNHQNFNLCSLTCFITVVPSVTSHAFAESPDAASEGVSAVSEHANPVHAGVRRAGRNNCNKPWGEAHLGLG